jgi:hypothetical protein
VRPEAGEAGRKDRGSGACLFVPQGRRITLRLRCCSLSAAPLVLLPPPFAQCIQRGWWSAWCQRRHEL